MHWLVGLAAAPADARLTAPRKLSPIGFRRLYDSIRERWPKRDTIIIYFYSRKPVVVSAVYLATSNAAKAMGIFQFQSSPCCPFKTPIFAPVLPAILISPLIAPPFSLVLPNNLQQTRQPSPLTQTHPQRHHTSSQRTMWHSTRRRALRCQLLAPSLLLILAWCLWDVGFD